MSNNAKSNLTDFLSGKLFSNGLEISIQESPYFLRTELLEKICESKKIIHIGFADHKDLIIKKIENNVWLHGRILKKAAKCVGIDINKEAIEFIQKKIGIKDLYCLDVEKDDLPLEILSEKWDYILIPEVIEHVDNPVNFLKNIKNKFSNISDKIVITVPNAFKFENFLNAMKNKEVINSDHRYWFTVYTIAKVLTLSGISIENFYLANSYHNSAFYEITKKSPLFRDDIIVIGKFF
ncbi:conserved hypothetical protein [Thermosipho africanus TCF52B]|jgi:hypothetical protein|uniref:Methyltransferase type 11 domain-containing protein n=1 Tax=Thermosipho africanus (strain TCF52B) TaxID=484019 RepID=B7ICR6_THEAB|nr:methyltransferase domain-containing protein [Thermosipho africanus]ACJ75793.1 conserved hypothetical protein [Thermosipho africanus TCF52B]